MSKLFRTLILVVFVTAIAMPASAQKTKEYTDVITHFEHAKMLYVKKQYVPSIKEFEKFLDTKPGPNFEYEARAYIGLSRLKLDKYGSSRDLAQFLRNEPEHKLNTEITYELGIHYFNSRNYSRDLKYLEKIDESDVTKKQRE
jgi:tetratricopeptide (TPR) repeat protein